MRTEFTKKQLENPDVAASEKILRNCVHCGFCIATCPTYVLLGDELDSPRGRINLIKDMLENDRDASDEIVTHVDRCLSCFSCMSTCPSGVNYMHLIDYARVHIARTYQRSFEDRMLRAFLAFILPRRKLFKLAVIVSLFLRPLAPILKKFSSLDRFSALLSLAPRRLPRMKKIEVCVPYKSVGRVLVMQGCVQPTLRPEIMRSTINLLTRHGFEVMISRGEGCCGSLAHHMGRKEEALKAARRMINLWTAEIKRTEFEAIIITTSGCGTTIKDYAHMLRDDPNYTVKAERIAGLAKDIHEFMVERSFRPSAHVPKLRVAYHAACSLQHGQKINSEPHHLLKQAGFEVIDVPEGHLCCGSAGTYNILQPEIAEALRSRKVSNIEKVLPDVVATGNIGCINQIAAGCNIPIVHSVELLDWASGGDMPQIMEGRHATETVVDTESDVLVG
jgi:glycolate oxidase iron-sulfur subunit